MADLSFNSWAEPLVEIDTSDSFEMERDVEMEEQLARPVSPDEDAQIAPPAPAVPVVPRAQANSRAPAPAAPVQVGYFTSFLLSIEHVMIFVSKKAEYKLRNLTSFLLSIEHVILFLG